jgi:peptidoglycan/xylan/chitin deacetylase (PgdA/CDA1 family)
MVEEIQHAAVETRETPNHMIDASYRVYNAWQYVKRVIKLCLSVIFYLVEAVWGLFFQMLGKSHRATCVVLHYHGVRSGERPKFARQMDTLIRLATPIPANNRNSLPAGERYAALTFDDGFLNVAENAIPELVARKIPATIFVVPSLLGGSPEWNTMGADYIRKERLISAAQLKALPSDLITIGSHTTTHAWLPSVTEAEAREEINASRDSLKSLLNREIDLFSFPFGGCNDQLLELCREAGYTRVFTIVPRLAFRNPQEFVTGRIEVNPSDWPVEFRLKLLGAYRWLPPVLKLKRKVLMLLHREESFARIPHAARYGPEA